MTKTTLLFTYIKHFHLNFNNSIQVYAHDSQKGFKIAIALATYYNSNLFKN